MVNYYSIIGLRRPTGKQNRFCVEVTQSPSQQVGGNRKVLTLWNKFVPVLFVAITNQRCIFWPRKKRWLDWTFIHRDCGRESRECSRYEISRGNVDLQCGSTYPDIGVRRSISFIHSFTHRDRAPGNPVGPQCGSDTASTPATPGRSHGE